MRFFFIVILSLTEVFGSWNPFNSNSKNCSQLIDLKIGSQLVYHTYDRNEKLIVKSFFKVADEDQTPDGKRFTLFSESKDSKSARIYDAAFVWDCKPGAFLIDLKNYLPPATMSAYQGMEIRGELKQIDYPVQCPLDQVFPDIILNLEAWNNSNKYADIKLQVNNRKMNGEESISCPAGTYKCKKMTYDLTISTVNLGFPATNKFTITEWFSNDVGMVRHDYYKKDKLINTIVLAERNF